MSLTITDVHPVDDRYGMGRGVPIARHYIKGPASLIPEGMLNRVEAGIRAFDPCLSCSTHAAGQMPLHLQLVGDGGRILDEVRR